LPKGISANISSLGLISTSAIWCSRPIAE